MNIYQRINEVRKAIGYVQKDKSVSTGGGSYKAVTHDQVTALLRAPMIEHGIVCVPNLEASAMNPKEEGAKQARYDATYSFDFVNMDEASDRITIKIEAHAMDNADKAPGKALSYAKKYAMLKLFEIETGENEESRYQVDEFDVVPFLEKMEKCGNTKDLQEAYLEATKAAKEAGDKEAINAVITVKDRVKNKLLGT